MSGSAADKAYEVAVRMAAQVGQRKPNREDFDHVQEPVFEEPSQVTADVADPDALIKELGVRTMRDRMVALGRERLNNKFITGGGDDAA